MNLSTKTRGAVSRIGLGMAALGRPGYINIGHADDLQRDYDIDRMRQRAHEVLDYAWRLGIRYFDAARSYGRAEEFLGSWLRSRNISKDDVFVASKWGYTYTADWQVDAETHEVKDHSLPVLQQQWQETQSNLGDFLKLYQIHSATLDSGVLEDAAVHRELARLKSQGVAIGLSLSGAGQGTTLRQALKVEVDGRPLFDAVQATWNLLETSAGGALRQAHAQGLAVIIKEGLANGRLTERNNAREDQSKLDALREIAWQNGVGIDAVALAAILAQPWVNIVLSGAATIEHLQSNILATNLALDDLPNLTEPPEVYWPKRSRLVWN